jgi:hypothetical protein
MTVSRWYTVSVNLLLAIFSSSLLMAQSAALPVSKVTVSPLFYVGGGAVPDGEEPGQPYGTCEDFELSVGGYAEGQIRIGIIESEFGGAGRLWNATTWQAALTAAQLLDFHPRAAQATITVRGSLDGPSAGCLLTVGILSAVLDHPIDPTVTMTGTINPDGVVGPVGGIYYKIGGAARAGKKVVLIPTQNRFEVHRSTGELVDLIQHGKQKGIDVRLVSDVWAAYRELTGKELPRDPPAGVPMLPPRASDHLAKRIDSWTKQAKTARKNYADMSDKGRNDRADESFEASDQMAIRSEKSRSQGHFAAAYADAQYAAMMAWAGYQVGRVEFAYTEGGLKAAKKVLEDVSWVDNRIDHTATALRFFRPATLEQLAIYMHACDTFIAGLCILESAANLRDNLPEDEETAGVWLVAAAERQAIAWTAMTMTMDFVELADVAGGTAVQPDAPFEQLAELYYRCAQAGQVVVDEIILTNIAEQNNVTREQAKNHLMITDAVYAINEMGLKYVYPQLSRYFGENQYQLRIARLSAATSLHTRSAMLIAKYYSLGAQLDEDFNVVGLSREAAFNDWIDSSQDQARRAIGALTSAKIDHTTCAQLYEIGRVYLARDLDDRLAAFEYFFQINVTAQTLKRLAKVPFDAGK